MKQFVTHAFLLLTLGLPIGGCGDDSGSKGGNGASAPGSSSPAIASSANLTCPTSSQCDQTETETYGKCVEAACDTEYRSCFGPDYASGKFDGGPCGDYYGCLAKCSCNDNECRTSCGVAPAECQLCIANGITACAASSGCKEPTCVTGTVKAPKTCDDLTRCCASITDPTYKTLCQTELSGSKTYGDAICDSFVRGFEQLGQCQ